MTELFRDPNFTRIGYFQSVLESEGIATHIRNEHLTMGGLSEIPIPEFYPALCVVDDSDHARAVKLLRQRAAENEAGSDIELVCLACKEPNPGNFEICWHCEEPLPVS